MVVGISSLEVSTCSKLSTSSITLPCNPRNTLPYLPPRKWKKLPTVRALSANAGHSSSSDKKNPLSVVLTAPQKFWRQTLHPLNNFGFGRRSIWEGGVGLFLVSGTVLLALSLAWLRAFQLRSKFRNYLAVFEFAQAYGISTGTPVRIRGVTVGSVIRVNPSLKSIDAIAEVEDDKIIIPRNSLVEVNQSGLLMETMIDITPQGPVPTPSKGPLDPECAKEGLVVCDRQKVMGCEGVSLDALIGLCIRLGRKVENIGVAKSYALLERVSLVIEEAKPLLTKIEAMAEDIQPLVTDVHNGGLLAEVERLTKSVTETCEDLRRVHSSMMTPENAELVQKSMHSLVFTLKNIENISSDISGLTGDETTRRNLKLLIKSLSRLL